MKKILVLLIFLPTFFYAQLNESDSLKIKASFALTGFWQGGNVQTLIFRAKNDFSIRFLKNWVYKTQNSYVYQEFGLQKADADILSLNFLYINPEKKIYPLVLAFMSTNFRREIDLRYLLGAGVTFKVIDKKEDWLKFSVTTEYENTNFKRAAFNFIEYNTNATINTFRGTIWTNGKFHLLKKKMIATHEVYFQPSLEDSNNYRWQADFGLEFPVFKYVNFKINYLHFFENIVIANQKQEDKFLTFGITLKTF